MEGGKPLSLPSLSPYPASFVVLLFCVLYGAAVLSRNPRPCALTRCLPQPHAMCPCDGTGP